MQVQVRTVGNVTNNKVKGSHQQADSSICNEPGMLLMHIVWCTNAVNFFEAIDSDNSNIGDNELINSKY